MKKIFFDFETTGLDPDACAVIEMAFLMEKGGEVVEEFHTEVRPHAGAALEETALKMAGHTPETLKALPKPPEVHAALTAFLGRHIDQYDRGDKAVLCGFNNRAFDDKFLRAWFERQGDKWFGSWFLQQSLDASPLALEYLLARRASMPSFRLRDVAKELGLPVDGDSLHGALYDARLAREIYRIVTGKEEEGLL
jgi:DNA polymerase-3 subunit epsilon